MINVGVRVVIPRAVTNYESKENGHGVNLRGRRGFQTGESPYSRTISSRFLPLVSIWNFQVTNAPRSEVPTRM